jgi:hypothetical protein
VGQEGVYQEDGTVDFGSHKGKIDLHRVIVVELGPVPVGAKAHIPTGPPQPVSHNYRSHPGVRRTPVTPQEKHTARVQAIGRKVAGRAWGHEDKELTEEDKEFLREEDRRDQRLFNPKPTEMEKKGEARRKKGADWSFD